MGIGGVREWASFAQDHNAITQRVWEATKRRKQIMSTVFRSALVIVAILAGTSATMARPQLRAPANTAADYDLNNPDDAKSFWEKMQRNGN